MIVSHPEEFKFLRFEKSRNKTKKYDALIQHVKTGKIKRVPFGMKGYAQYKDKTGLGLYSSLDHGDLKSRKNYRKRHFGEDKNKFSSGYFSWKYMW